MNTCGSLEALSGGTFNRTTIIGSQMSGSRISDSEFAGGDISKLSSIDAASASVLADALSELPDDKLLTLAAAIFRALRLKDDAPIDTTTAEPTLPTTMRGTRSLLLGEPDKWLVLQEGMHVPAYK